MLLAWVLVNFEYCVFFGRYSTVPGAGSGNWGFKLPDSAVWHTYSLVQLFYLVFILVGLLGWSLCVILGYNCKVGLL